MFCFVFGKFILTGVCQRRCRNAFTTWFSANNDSIKCHMCVFFGVFADSSFLWFYLAIPVKNPYSSVLLKSIIFTLFAVLRTLFIKYKSHIPNDDFTKICSWIFLLFMLPLFLFCFTKFVENVYGWSRVKYVKLKPNVMLCDVYFSIHMYPYFVYCIHISEWGYVEIVNIYINVSMCGSHQSLRVLKWNWPVGFVSCWFIIYLR